jgi:hypothetical protein
VAPEGLPEGIVEGLEEHGVEECLTCLAAFPAMALRRIRTTDGLERLN